MGLCSLRSQASLVPRSPRLLRSGCSCSWLTWEQDGPKADVAVRVRRVVVAAERRAAAVRDGVPIAATEHPVRARSRPMRIGRRRGGVAPPPIPTPLEQVAGHVEKAISVRGKVTHRAGIRVVASLETRMIAPRRTGVAGVAGGTVIVNQATASLRLRAPGQGTRPTAKTRFCRPGALTGRPTLFPRLRSSEAAWAGRAALAQARRVNWSIAAIETTPTPLPNYSCAECWVGYAAAGQRVQ